MFSLRALRPALVQPVALARPPSTLLAARLSAAGLNRYRYSSTLETSEPPLSLDNQVLAIEDGLKLAKPLTKRWNITRGYLPFLWLRDNCRCAKCVNQLTRQRNFDTFSIPSDVRPAEAPSSDTNGITVKWTDGHESLYAWDFIRFYLKNSHRKHDDKIRRHYWGAEVAEQQPTVVYDEVMGSDTGVAKLTRHIRQFGFAFVKGTPYDDPDKTRELLERIGPIRVTHYGGFYDFIPDMAMADTAYTNIALPAHTDNTYFTEPAGLQAFHLLSHQPAPGASPDEAASGGKSLLVDGFNAARILREEDRRAFEVLCKVRLPWHASGNEGITIAPDRRYPVLEIGTNLTQPFRVRWNNDDRGVVPFSEGFEVGQWYDAARKWNEILKRKDSEFWFQLEPGTVLIFDNWRVLHGRSAFSGIRRICGGYINRDDYISRYRNTNFGRERALERVIG